MLKEGAFIEEGTPESIEQELSFSKEKLKGFLETRTRITDAGRSGILFRIDPSELSPADQENLAFENEDNPEGSLSIKALKVFNLDEARQEFESLQEARRIILENIDSSSEEKPIFRVPRGLHFDEIDVDAKTERFLNKNGASIKSGKVGVITMDWIEGKNLAVYLHEELMRRTPQSRDLDFETVVDTQDFRALIRALGKTGYVLPEGTFDQLKNGVDALHKGKLWHNDLHLGNVIVRPDGQLYAIDFADAGHDKKNIEDADGEFYLSDENILNILEPLTKSPEIKARARVEDDIREWNVRSEALKNDPRAYSQYEMLKTAAGAHDTARMENHLIGAATSDKELEGYLSTLFKIAHEDELQRETVLSFLHERLMDKKTKLRAFVINRLQALQKAIEI